MPRRVCGLVGVAAMLAAVSAARAADGDAAEMLAAAGVRSGLVLRVGGGDLGASAALAKSGRYVVHQLVPADKVEGLRAEALEMGIHGRVVISPADGAGALPHPARLVDAVLIERAGLVKDGEAARVLNVGGKAFAVSGGAWKPLVMAPPEGLDEWSHKWHGPSGNVLSRDTKAGPPVTVQWVSGPALADGATGGKHPVIAGGRHAVVDNVDGAAMVRSAGSGLPLWRLPANLAVPADLVLDGDRLLCRPQNAATVKGRQEAGPPVAFDLTTGKLATTYGEAPQARSVPRQATSFPWTLAIPEGLLAAGDKELALLDRATGKRKWTVSLKDGSWFSPVVLDGLVIAAELAPGGASRRGRIDNALEVAAISAYAVADGSPRWRMEDPLKHAGRKLPEPSASLVPLVAGEGKIFLHTTSYQCRAPDAFIAAVDAATGRELWRYTLGEGVKGMWSATDSASRVVVRERKLYYIGGHSLGGVAVFDAATGKIVHDFVRRTGFVGYGGECSGSLATVNYLVMSGVTWWDKDLKMIHRPGSRSACGTGVFPAQGMVFANPTGCDCTQYTRGYIGLGCEPLPESTPDAQRLAKGPAQAPGTDVAERDAWPMFLANVQRTSAVSAELPEKLVEKFRVAAAPPRIAGLISEDQDRDEYWAGAITAPVSAGGKVVVGLSDAGAIAAFDAAAGKLAWRVPVGGPIDTPPTLYKGLVVAGCQDGNVYALRLDTGARVWTFNAAPAHRRAMLNGRLASAFPVPGSVMVLKDTLLVTAGYHSYLGGVQVWALDPMTGAVKGRDMLRGGETANQGNMVLNDILCASADGSDAWIYTGCRIDAGGKLAPLPGKRADRPAPTGAAVMRIDRRAAVVRFTSAGRGGSTHGWGRPMASGPVQAYRVARDGLSDIPNPSAQYTKVPVVWAQAADSERKGEPAWQMLPKDLGVRDGYTAMIKAGTRLYLAGGSRDGKKGFVQALSAKDGKLIQEIELPAQVMPCGLAAAGGRLYASCVDGTLVALGE